MSITITSTTSSDSELQHAVSDSWRTPPTPETKESKSGESIPLDKLPPKKFNEVRNEQVREKKEGARDSLNGEEQRYRHKGAGVQKRFDRLTAQRAAEQARAVAAESRAEAAERRAAELEARLNGNGNSPAPASPEAQKPEASTSAQPAAKQETAPAPKTTDAEFARQVAEAENRYPDFKETIAAAKKADIRISESLGAAIKAVPNTLDVTYFLAKNPGLVAELERDPSRITQISQDLQRAPQAASTQSLLKKISETSTEAERNELVSGLQHNELGRRILSSMTRELNLLPNPLQVSVEVLKDAQRLQEMSRMPQNQVAMILGAISAKLEKSSNQPAKEKVRPADPITPVGSSSTRAGLSLEEMPLRDFIRTRNKQERSRRY